ncbi:MAG: hypothetical protein GC136_10885 [Alphaproteobacteria bacterium]|nr:hypothetical protein [Alphaproteobacteria bacterium]
MSELSAEKIKKPCRVEIRILRGGEYDIDLLHDIRGTEMAKTSTRRLSVFPGTPPATYLSLINSKGQRFNYCVDTNCPTLATATFKQTKLKRAVFEYNGTFTALYGKNDYDDALSIPITTEEYNALVKDLKAGHKSTYNLITNNCSGIVANFVLSHGHHVPMPEGIVSPGSLARAFENAADSGDTRVTTLEMRAAEAIEHKYGDKVVKMLGSPP